MIIAKREAIGTYAFATAPLEEPVWVDVVVAAEDCVLEPLVAAGTDTVVVTDLQAPLHCSNSLMYEISKYAVS